MRCPNCRADRVIQIRIKLHNEERLDFHSCHKCEHKWWKDTESESPPIPLNEVLSRATVQKRKSA